jgi:hypothetical protein
MDAYKIFPPHQFLQDRQWQYIRFESVLRTMRGNCRSELIQDIQLQANILEPEALISTPEAFLNMEGKQTVTAAVVYRYGMTPDHGAKPGLMPDDRRDLAEKIADFIASTLIFTETPKKVPYVSLRSIIRFLQKRRLWSVDSSSPRRSGTF